MSMKTNGDMPAMPFEEVRSRFQGLPDKWANHCGLTKREMMAMAAMQGLLTNSSGGYSDYKHMAQDAVTAADTLLAELEHNNE